MKSELKPCPCCHDGALVQHTYPDEKMIVCTACGVSAEISVWNTRPIENALRAELEKTQAVLDGANDVFETAKAGMQNDFVKAAKKLQNMRARIAAYEELVEALAHQADFAAQSARFALSSSWENGQYRGLCQTVQTAKAKLEALNAH